LEIIEHGVAIEIDCTGPLELGILYAGKHSIKQVVSVLDNVEWDALFVLQLYD